MLTRSMSGREMSSIIELKVLIENLRKDLGDKIDSLVKKIEEKDAKINELSNKVTLLEEKIAYSDKRFELLERRLDDSEQYTRRTSLRINGIAFDGNETAGESLQKVKDEVGKLGLNLDDRDFDRAHRVGSPKDQNGKKKKERQMIVKFTSFKARTLVYQSRPKFNKDRVGGVRFYLDQTKRRFDLRKYAVEYVKNIPGVDFVFVDINCSLCIRFKNGDFKHFNSETELVSLVG